MDIYGDALCGLGDVINVFVAVYWTSNQVTLWIGCDDSVVCEDITDSNGNQGFAFYKSQYGYINNPTGLPLGTIYG